MSSSSRTGAFNEDGGVEARVAISVPASGRAYWSAVGEGRVHALATRGQVTAVSIDCCSLVLEYVGEGSFTELTGLRRPPARVHGTLQLDQPLAR